MPADRRRGASGQHHARRLGRDQRLELQQIDEPSARNRRGGGAAAALVN
jgi:hypothetical protein